MRDFLSLVLVLGNRFRSLVLEKYMSDTTLEDVTARLEHVIDTIVNPKLLEHKGWIELADVDLEERLAIVRFRGACSGCGATEDTLQKTVLPLIRQNVKEIKHVEQTEDIDPDVWEMAKSLFSHKDN